VKAREKIKRLDRKEISARIRSNQLTKDDQRILLLFVRIVPALLETLRKNRRRLGSLLDMVWGKKTESARDILKEIDKAEEARAATSESSEETTTEAGTAQPPPTDTNKPDATSADQASPPRPDNVIALKPPRKYKKNRAQGLRGVAAYPDAKVVECAHPNLHAGDTCPKCGTGALYLLKAFGKFIQFAGSAILRATIYRQQKLRCNSCGAIFSAPLPDGVSGPRGAPSASAMIALVKYGAGFPFYRLSQLQKHLKTPLSPAGIWKMLEPLIEVAQPVFKEMCRQAANGEVLYNDDTVNKVLALLGLRKKVPPGEKTKKTRKKIFTSGILSKLGSTQIVLFFTGHRHAGENLEALLKERDITLATPIQMSDASTMNTPGKIKTENSACLTHCRRYFVKSYRDFKQAVTYVIRKLKIVYQTEAQAKKNKLSPAERLKLHQSQSGPIMVELKKWMDDQIDNKKVEENSSLGEAIEYARRHWQELTLFLRVPGAPLTNDELEQKFKMVKQHLKNSLFYKTLWGALVGDIFMSIIHTCVLAGENPFDYLVAIQEHREKVLKNTGDWMPWNYRKAIPVAAGVQKTA
jgi:transposase